MTQRDRQYAWLQEARRLLVEAVGAELGSIHVRLFYEWSGHGVEFVLPPANGADWPAEIVSTADAPDTLHVPPDTPPDTTPDIPVLREVEANALAAATASLVTVQQLAQRAGYEANSYFRAAVASLVRAGFLERSGRQVRRRVSADSQR